MKKESTRRKKKVILTYMVMPWCSITHSVHWSHCIHLHCAHTIHIVHAIYTSHIVHVAHTIHILLVGCLVMHPHIAHLKAKRKNKKMKKIKNKIVECLRERYFVVGFEYFMDILQFKSPKLSCNCCVTVLKWDRTSLLKIHLKTDIFSVMLLVLCRSYCLLGNRTVSAQQTILISRTQHYGSKWKKHAVSSQLPV